jgi:hypothetical protein
VRITAGSADIFLISKLGISMQFMTSGKSAIMSLLLMVMLATIRFSAIFLAAWFLSFFPPVFSSARSSATLPCDASAAIRTQGGTDPCEELRVLARGAHCSHIREGQ